MKYREFSHLKAKRTHVSSIDVIVLCAGMLCLGSFPDTFSSLNSYLKKDFKNQFVVIVQMCVIENNKQNLILENLSLDLMDVEYECTGKFNVKGTKGSMTVFY